MALLLLVVVGCCFIPIRELGGAVVGRTFLRCLLFLSVHVSQDLSEFYRLGSVYGGGGAVGGGDAVGGGGDVGVSADSSFYLVPFTAALDLVRCRQAVLHQVLPLV